MDGTEVTDSRPPIVEARGFSKTFGGRTVLRDAAITIRPGEIRGLVGQNGSGKSTFIKILSGYHAPDRGATLEVRGKPVDLPLDPGQPERLGLSFVHQDLGLFQSGSVLENLLVGRYETRPGWRISWRHETRRACRLLETFGLGFDPATPLSELTEVERAIVAIARAMSGLGSGGGLLVLDEPSARLPRDTVSTFFRAVRDVAARGVGVLFVSHRLEEVLDLTDTVTVLRDGVVVADRRTTEMNEGDLVDTILGFSLEKLYPEPHHPGREVAMTVTGLTGPVVDGLSTTVHRGEILGLTGLLGMGHDLVPHLLFGSIPATGGTIEIGGVTREAAEMTPRSAIAAGLALLPANRLREGGVGMASVAENMTLAILGEFHVGGVLRHRREERSVEQLMGDFGIQPAAPRQALGTLSGGNQQKALVAKWFATQPRLMLLDEPTHGVDVGAKKQIFQHLRDAAEAGTGILVASVEAEDLAQVCDRVLVFRHGRVVGELSGSELSAARIRQQTLVGHDSGDVATGQASEQPRRGER
jgi:ribose transport system ATP-binding protein